MQFDLSISASGVTLTPKRDTGLLHRLFRRGAQTDLTHLTDGERSVAYAIADARALADGLKEAVSIDSDRIFMPHRLVASLERDAAEVLGLPPISDLTLKTDAEGIVGSSNFKLRYEWIRNGQRQLPVRTGAVLQTAAGLRRLPLWMMEAIEVADQYSAGNGDISDWEALH